MTRAGDRGRGLCRRHRHGARRLPADGRAARHRADRGPADAALAHGRRAGDLPRRRQGRSQGGEPRHRPRLAAAGARQVALLRAAARGAGPRRSRPLRRQGRDRGGAGRGAPAGRHAVDAGGRGRAARHARATCRLRAPAEGAARADPRRDDAQALPARDGRAAGAALRQRGSGAGRAARGRQLSARAGPGRRRAWPRRIPASRPLGERAAQGIEPADADQDHGAGPRRGHAKPSFCWRWRAIRR